MSTATVQRDSIFLYIHVDGVRYDSEDFPMEGTEYRRAKGIIP